MPRSNYLPGLLLTVILSILTACDGIEHVISWNSTNQMFLQHRLTIEARLNDIVRFVCPDNEGKLNGEYLTVYEVGELAYDDCLVETTSREILRCGPENAKTRSLGAPNSPRNVAQLIRQLNPIPNGKEFQPGQTYHYITTSTGRIDGIDKKTYGLCESKNMRLALKVLPAVYHPVKPINSKDEEDEDSENDSSQPIPRHLDGKEPVESISPKFRRPSQFNEAAASAGVLDQQFFKVAQMAKEGKTGTFENTKEYIPPPSSPNGKANWDPINVQFVSDIIQNAYHNVDENLSYQREPDYLIHEENSVRSLEYSSMSSEFASFALLKIVIFLIFTWLVQ